MIIFLCGLIIFFAIHSISIVSVEWRNNIVGKLGEGAWRGLYSLVAISGFLLMTWGYGQARFDSPMLYSPPTWLQHISLVLLLPVFPLLIATYFPGRIQETVKHPMLLSVKIWAFAHLLANGELVSVILFGVFLGWAVVDRISLKKRPKRSIPGAPAARFNDIIAVVGGIGLYVAFIVWLHEFLIGVSPL